MSYQNVNPFTEDCKWCRGSGRIAPGWDCGPCGGSGRRIRHRVGTTDDTPRQGAPDGSEQECPTAFVVLVIVVRA